MLQNTFIDRKAQLRLLDDFLKKAAGGQLQVKQALENHPFWRNSFVAAKMQIPRSSPRWVNATHAR